MDHERKELLAQKKAQLKKRKKRAEVMNKTPNWVRVTYFRGKQKIKEDKS